MKIIQHINGVVLDIINARDDATADNVAVVESIPRYEPRDGYSGALMYDGNGLYWDYVENEESEDVTAEEALEIMLGGDA